MVRLHTSLLALTFATGLVLASSDDYQRRDDELFDRNIDEEKLGKFFQKFQEYALLHERSDTFDEPEARSLFGGLLKVGEEFGKKAIKGRVGMAMKVAKTAAKLEHHGGSAKRIKKQLGTVRKVEKNLKSSKKIAKQQPSKRIVKQLKRIAKQANKNRDNDKQNKANQNRVNQDLQRARKEVADADRYLPANRQYRIKSRGLEDDEELSRRGLDTEDVFGREYDDLLDERDTFDDLD
jgi:hypothetical protein